MRCHHLELGYLKQIMNIILILYKFVRLNNRQLKYLLKILKEQWIIFHLQYPSKFVFWPPHQIHCHQKSCHDTNFSKVSRFICITRDITFWTAIPISSCRVLSSLFLNIGFLGRKVEETFSFTLAGSYSLFVVRIWGRCKAYTGNIQDS